MSIEITLQVIILIFAFVSTLILLLKEWEFIKKMLNNLKLRINYIFWSKADKKKSEELIKKYQLSKSTIGVKEVVVSKAITRKPRH